MAKERTEVFEYHLQGLPQVPKNANCRLSVEDHALKIEHMTGGLFSNKNVEATYRIPLDRLISMDVVSEADIKEKSKSVLGRGVAGALVFGPVGALLGGMSGIGTKKKKTYKYLLNVAYIGNDSNDVRMIIFQVSMSTFDASAFAKYVMNQCASENPEKEKRDITL